MILLRGGFGWVDPGHVREFRWFWWFADEPFGMCRVGGVQDDATCLADLFGSAVVHVGRDMKADP